MDKLVYTRDEAAQLLGVSAQTIDKYIKKGAIQHIRLGQRVMIPRDWFNRFLNGEKAS